VKPGQARLAGHWKTIYVAIAALKTASKCSFTTRKLRFFGRFCLALAASPTFFNDLLARDDCVTKKTNGHKFGTGGPAAPSGFG